MAMKAKYVLVVVCWLCVGCPPQMEFVVDRVDRQTIGYGRCGCATFWLSVTRQTGASEKRSWSTRSQSRRGPNTADSFCRRIHGFPTRDASAKNPSCCPSSLVLFENFTVVVCVAWRCLEVLAVVVVLGVVGLSDPTHTAAHHTNWRKKKTNLGKYTCKRASERTDAHETRHTRKRKRNENHASLSRKRKQTRNQLIGRRLALPPGTTTTTTTTTTKTATFGTFLLSFTHHKRTNVIVPIQKHQQHQQRKGPNVGAFTQSISQSISQSINQSVSH